MPVEYFPQPWMESIQRIAWQKEAEPSCHFSILDKGLTFQEESDAVYHFGARLTVLAPQNGTFY